MSSKKTTNHLSIVTPLMGIPDSFDDDYIGDYIIERHRVDCDGKGVSTLIIMGACHLNCKYCPNRLFIKRDTKYVWKEKISYLRNQILWGFANHFNSIDVANIIEEVKVDELYFRMTGGGVVFGGGEPLLFVTELKDFKTRCPSWWPLRIETTLNVRTKDVETVIDVFDQWIIDVKTLNSNIYRAYTGYSNLLLLKNLKYLASKGLQNKVLIRLPLIPGFNDEKDIEESQIKLINLGYQNFDIFEYQKEFSTQKDDIQKCEYLRNIRREAAMIAGVEYTPAECNRHSEVCISCNGHCIGCDQELAELTKAYMKKIDKKL